MARPVRDAQRLEDGAKHWAKVSAETANVAPDHRLDAITHAIAEDVRVTMRSVIGIVFRLDHTSGALHALGVDGAVLPVVKRGQLLPPGFGSAGQAIARRATFVADNCASGTVRVPPIMSEAVPNLPPFTTLSTPLIVEGEVIGALTVSRQIPVPYDQAEMRLIQALAAVVAPVLARSPRQSDDARRQQGATELSRLAGSLTQSLSLAAVGERLVQAVISLVHGTDAAFWDARGRLTIQQSLKPSFAHSRVELALFQRLAQALRDFINHDGDVAVFIPLGKETGNGREGPSCRLLPAPRELFSALSSSSRFASHSLRVPVLRFTFRVPVV